MSDVEGTIALLAARIPGVGEVKARAIVRILGANAFERVRSNPYLLQHVPGCGPAVIARARAALAKPDPAEDFIRLLGPYGVSAATCRQLQRRWSAPIEAIRENPYRLVGTVAQFGFAKADAMAKRFDISPGSPVRLEAAVRALFQSVRQSGDSAATPDKIESIWRQLPAEGGPGPLPPFPQVKPWAMEHRLLVEKHGLIQERWLAYAEDGISYNLGRLRRTSHPLMRDVVQGIARAVGEAIPPLSEQQKEALRRLLRERVLLLTGGPGTGKTTVLRTLGKGLERGGVEDGDVLWLAPTGRAAQRMREVTGRPAQTIHRALGMRPMGGHAVPAFSHKNRWPVGFVVVDEMSMVGSELAAQLFDAIPDGACVLLVGDPDQLPSVEPGAVLRDLVGLGMPHARLIELHRQARGSAIAQGARQILAGKVPVGGEGLDLVAIDDEEQVARWVVDAARAEPDLQVLTPGHDGTCGTKALNERLQALLNPPGAPEMVNGGVHWRVGDRVLQTRNRYDDGTLLVANGTHGVIAALIPGKKPGLAVRFEDGTEVRYAQSEIWQLAHAWALTIHKSQGSEYQGLVVIPITQRHAHMLDRTLFYTALTRAKVRCAVVGSPRHWRMAAWKNAARMRVTALGVLRSPGTAPHKPARLQRGE